MSTKQRKLRSKLSFDADEEQEDATAAPPPPPAAATTGSKYLSRQWPVPSFVGQQLGVVGAAVGRACSVNGGRRAETVAAGSASAAAVRPSGRIGALVHAQNWESLRHSLWLVQDSPPRTTTQEMLKTVPKIAKTCDFLHSTGRINAKAFFWPLKIYDTPSPLILGTNRID